MNPNPILELYGIPTDTPQQDWVTLINAAKCPFLNDRCRKARKSDSTATIGTCSVRHSQRDIVICPYRMLEQHLVFRNCIPLLQPKEGDDVHVVSEIQVTGGSVDYCLVSVRQHEIVNFIGIELQAVDTTGSLWPYRQRFLQPNDSASNLAGSFGINWKMSAKTILIQLLHKTRTFEEMNKKLVAVFQTHLFDYLRNEFQFDHLPEAESIHSLHIHVYNFQRSSTSYTLQFHEQYGLTSEYIAKSLGLRREGSAELDSLTRRLARKISPSNRLLFDEA
ncbi:NotI family restriction endonuclease [Chloroflexus sp.]|uniref:NotI family restriction endonuclease n=1 Tax=Chloroflexus sp. TaxID=1904827 RepID=UPI00298F2889|nr:NotI family restriction endonuclease [Chloroflexus sp.]MCX7858878.1 NotI family restriction endonuclease [Chloroflexus sp.]MDW8404609.1 NotI family restriction endonuclease [Chloroflexus sp.]